MGDVSTLVGLVGGILGVAGVIAAGVVVVRGKIATATISLLNENLNAQRQRIDLLTKENSHLTARVAVLESTNDELFEQLKSLPAYADMADNIATMNEAMTAQAEMIQQWLADVSADG